MEFGSLDLNLYIRRTVLVKAYVIILVVAMCESSELHSVSQSHRYPGLIALLLLAISVRATFFQYEVDVTILAAPVATLFAFTTLRTAMPGSPSAFGMPSPSIYMPLLTKASSHARCHNRCVLCYGPDIHSPYVQ